MAREMIDYLLVAVGTEEEQEDLLISGGDWKQGESTYQHQRQLILNGKGDYKANPTICVDASNYIDNEDKGAVKRAIAKEFMRDGMTVKDLTPNTESVSDNTVRVFNNSYYT